MIKERNRRKETSNIIDQLKPNLPPHLVEAVPSKTNTGEAAKNAVLDICVDYLESLAESHTEVSRKSQVQQHIINSLAEMLDTTPPNGLTAADVQRLRDFLLPLTNQATTEDTMVDSFVVLRSRPARSFTQSPTIDRTYTSRPGTPSSKDSLQGNTLAGRPVSPAASKTAKRSAGQRLTTEQWMTGKELWAGRVVELTTQKRVKR